MRQYASCPQILMTSQVFPPERHPSGILWMELAEYFSSLGCEVTVATGFPNHPEGRLFPGVKRKISVTEKMNGFSVTRTFHLISSRQTALARGLMMLSQGVSFCLSGFLGKKPDLIFCGAPPLVGPFFSQLLARIFKARVVYVIADIYPDILVNTGWLKSPLLISLAKILENITYRYSDYIVVLADGFRATLIKEKKVEPEKIKVIPLWLDRNVIVPMDRDNAWRREMGIPSAKFVVLYAGTMGVVSGATVIIEAAAKLAKYSEIVFLLVGTGQVRSRLEEMAREKGLDNLRFVPFQPRERLSEVQATADVSLVTLAPDRGKTSVPSKLLGYMAAARPVVASVDLDCDLANIVRQAGCGVVVPPGDGEALAQAVLAYYQQPHQRASHGQKGREYFMEHFVKEAVMQEYKALIEKLISPTGSQHIK